MEVGGFAEPRISIVSSFAYDCVDLCVVHLLFAGHCLILLRNSNSPQCLV